MKNKTTEIEVKVVVDGREYRAARDARGKVSIDRRMDDARWEWCGNGTWDGGVTNCAARLGDGVYQAIDDAIDDAILASA